MAEAVATATLITIAGVESTETTGTAGTADGTKVLNLAVKGQTVLAHFFNTTAGALTITMTAYGTTEQGSVANKSITLPASKGIVVGPITDRAFCDSTNYTHFVWPSGAESSVKYRFYYV